MQQTVRQHIFSDAAKMKATTNVVQKKYTLSRHLAAAYGGQQQILSYLA
jgi:hypothetical protein